MSAHLTESAAVLIVILVGFLPTEVWRSLAIIAGRRLEAGSEPFLWVKAVASALLAAVIARLLLAPAGQLQAVPLMLRLGVVAIGIAAFLVAKRSVLAGVLVGEVLIIAAAWWYGG